MNEIVKSPNVLQTFDDVERAAKAMSASGFFPDSKQAAQAIVKVLAGRELGFGAFASMTGVSVIQGKPVIGANLLAAAVKQTGKYNYHILLLNENECKIEFIESGKAVGVSSFSMDDAKAANLTGKDNWKKYPRNMLFARAISNGQKWYAPDVFNGVTVYTPDELGATVDDEGNFIEAEVKQSEPLQIESTTPAPKITASNKHIWTFAQKQALIDEHLADNDFAAKGMLSLSNLKDDATEAEIIAWGKLYREHRTAINPETTKPYLAPQAAEFANNGGK
jgi:hypothetical protein